MTGTLFDGMHSAGAHAERDAPGWTSDALAFLCRFAERHPEFTAEECVGAAAGAVKDPPDSRAWGAVFNAASRRGLIVKTGEYRAAKTSNGSPKPVWRKGSTC